MPSWELRVTKILGITFCGETDFLSHMGVESRIEVVILLSLLLDIFCSQ